MFMCTKEASEKLQSMRFKLQLSREDQKTPILQLQEIVRWVGLGCVSGFCRTQHFSYLWSLLIELYLYMLICCFTHSWSGHFDCSFLTADGSNSIFMADSTNANMHTFTLVTVCVCVREFVLVLLAINRTFLNFLFSGSVYKTWENWNETFMLPKWIVRKNGNLDSFSLPFFF